ncbi:hypothetical protein AB0C90_00365 [Streptomyces sp. NPDC048550]|uniref:hypothetical protein n=1 Tax=Streptomyces sp. NPDC048550 TaxID=3155739 RepID=UPI00341B3031
MRWWKRADAECTTVADRLVIPQPFDLGVFCAGIAEQRGRPLILLPLDGAPDPALPCGIRLGLEVADLVFYDAVAAEILKVQIVLHEISHMLLGHVAPELELPQQPSEGEIARASEHFHRLLTRTQTTVSGLDRPDLPVASIIRTEAARIRTVARMTESIDEELGLDIGRLAHAGIGWGLLGCLFAAAIPLAFIKFGIRRGRWADRHVGQRRQRIIVMTFVTGSVATGIALLWAFGAPRAMIALISAMLVTLAALLAVTPAWKISVHAAVSCGSVAMLAMTYGPWALLAYPLVAVVGWSRVELKDHTLAQVLVGAGVGGAVAAGTFALVR